MKFKLLFATTLLAFSAISAAQSIRMEMMQMNMQLNKLMRAETAEDFQTSAQKLIDTTEQTKAKLPENVIGNKAATEDYQAGMDAVVNVVKKANEQAQAGKLQEAKITVAELELLKREYHQKYK